MIEWLLQVKTISPLVLHAERASAQFARTLTYIPGANLRGALADMYLKTGTQDANFRRLFLEDGCLFPNLYPSDEEGEGAPLPATARVCKRFKFEHADSLSDALLPLCFMPDKTRKDWEWCPNAECRRVDEHPGNKRDHVEGFRLERDVRRTIRPHTRTVAGTSILRVTQTAASGQLFSHMVVEEGTQFSGRIRLADAAAAERLREVLYKVPLRVGYGRSRGLGLLEIEQLKESPEPALPALAERLNRFNAAIQHRSGPSNGARYAALMVESDVLLRDELLRPVTTLTGTDGKVFGLTGMTLKRAFVVPALAHGWSAVLGLPKPDAPGLGRSSVFLFTLDDEAAEAQLASLEATGIGERRAEGFGRVRVCDPFHYAFFAGG